MSWRYKATTASSEGDDLEFNAGDPLTIFWDMYDVFELELELESFFQSQEDSRSVHPNRNGNAFPMLTSQPTYEKVPRPYRSSPTRAHRANIPAC